MIFDWQTKVCLFFFFQAEDGIRDADVTGVQTSALPIWPSRKYPEPPPGSSKSRTGPSGAPAAEARLRIRSSSGFEPEKVTAATAGSPASATETTYGMSSVPLR